MYQQNHADLSNSAVEVEGDFEGKDADEPWLGEGRSWVSQSSKHWVNGEYLLGVDADPDDPGMRSDEEEEEDEDE